jgi:hypothetical protein
VKLLFAAPEQLPKVVGLIEHQRQAYLRQLYLLGVQRRRLERTRTEGFVTGLLIDGAEVSVRAELAWLDDVAQKLKGRIAANSQ